jgi:FkbM family methyltransferase
MERLGGATLAFTSDRRIPLGVRRRVARWLVPRDGSGFRVSIDGLEYEGKLDNYIEWVVYATRSFFEYTYINVIESLVHGGIALDVGANVGNHTLAFSRLFDRVLAFEPLPRLADRLEAKVAARPNVTVHRVALSDRNGVARFAPPTTYNWGKGKIDDAGTRIVQVVRGDELLAARDAGRVNFVKIDVEGHEVEVLSGLRHTIARDRPVVMFEVPDSFKKGRGRNPAAALESFPECYRFGTFRNQTTFPIQTERARLTSLDRDNPSFNGRTSYVLAYGEERGFEIRRNRIGKRPVRR